MTSGLPHESLLALAKRLEAERSRIVELLLAAPEDQPLNSDLLGKLAVVQGACAAVAAEIEKHTPTVGYGSEA